MTVVKTAMITSDSETLGPRVAGGCRKHQPVAPPSAAAELPANIDHVGIKRWWIFGTVPIGPGGW